MEPTTAIGRKAALEGLRWVTTRQSAYLRTTDIMGHCNASLSEDRYVAESTGALDTLLTFACPPLERQLADSRAGKK